MASLRKHKRSPFWYLYRRNLDTGKWEERSTGLKTSDASDTRKAQRLADKYTIEEKRVGSTRVNPAFNIWVPSFIGSHWGNRNGDSRRRYTVAWQAIRAFLEAHSLIFPRQIRYEHGQAYLRWRLATHVHGRAVGHNTALLELKFFSQLLNEAIRREFAEVNPLARLGIGRVAQKIKPELTDEQISILNQRLKNEPEWMRIAFAISLYSGCRFSECSIPLANIDLERRTMRLRDAKRAETDPRKYFTVPVDENLVPIFQRLKAAGAEVTCQLSRDKNGRINYFFRQCGIDASFHSLRVTFVTRCHRAGLSMTDAMLLVNHSSQLVHRIYSRLNVEDVREARSKVQLPKLEP